MGIGGISVWQLLIILVIVVLIFGTKKLKNMGGDIGGAVKNFKSAMKDGEKDAESEGDELPAEEIEAQAAKKEAEADSKKS